MLQKEFIYKENCVFLPMELETIHLLSLSILVIYSYFVLVGSP